MTTKGGTAVVLGLGLALTACTAKPAAPAQPTERQQITSLCHAAVLDRLKAPATARFLPEGDTIEGRSRFEMYLVGEVDAENGFSALVRSTFRCHLTKPAGDWAATDVNLTERS